LYTSVLLQIYYCKYYTADNLVLLLGDYTVTWQAVVVKIAIAPVLLLAFREDFKRTPMSTSWTLVHNYGFSNFLHQRQLAILDYFSPLLHITCDSRVNSSVVGDTELTWKGQLRIISWKKLMAF